MKLSIAILGIVAVLFLAPSVASQQIPQSAATVNYPLAAKLSVSIVQSSLCATGLWLVSYSMTNIGSVAWDYAKVEVINISSSQSLGLNFESTSITSGARIGGGVCTYYHIISNAVYEAILVVANKTQVANVGGSLRLEIPVSADGLTHSYSTFPSFAFDWKQSLKEGTPTIWKFKITNVGTLPLNTSANIDCNLCFTSHSFFQTPYVVIQHSGTLSYVAKNQFIVPCHETLPITETFDGVSLTKYSDGSFLEIGVGYNVDNFAPSNISC